MSALLASSSSVSILQMSSLLETLTAEIGEFRRLLQLATSVATPPKPASVASSKVTDKFEFPAHTEGEPSVADYRFPKELIDETLCLARNVGNLDYRWSIAVFTERQCGRPQKEGSNLCVKCFERYIKYSTNPQYRNWCGLINEEPLEWQHMLGTDWASNAIAVGKLVFYVPLVTTTTEASSDVTSETKSVNSTVSSYVEEMKADAERRIVAAKEILAQQKARKEAEKAEKMARKEAEKAEKMARKEAEKAEKEAEKLEKKARKMAEKAALVVDE